MGHLFPVGRDGATLAGILRQVPAYLSAPTAGNRGPIGATRICSGGPKTSLLIRTIRSKTHGTRPSSVIGVRFQTKSVVCIARPIAALLGKRSAIFIGSKACPWIRRILTWRTSRPKRMDCGSQTICVPRRRHSNLTGVTLSSIRPASFLIRSCPAKFGRRRLGAVCGYFGSSNLDSTFTRQVSTISISAAGHQASLRRLAGTVRNPVLAGCCLFVRRY